MDQRQAAADFRKVGLELLDEIKTVKDKSVRSRCEKCGDLVQYSYLQVKERIARGTGLTGCRKCFKRRDDAEVEKVLLDAGLTPLEKYPGAGIPWRFECQECGSISKRALSHIQRGKGCPVCGVRNRVDPRWITEEDARQIFRGAGLEPLEEYPGKVYLPWRAECFTCGNEVSPALREIRAGQGGCRYCARVSQAETNRRPQEKVEALFRSKNMELLSEYERNRNPVEARCLVCKKVASVLVKTVEEGLGCPYCNQRRVDPHDAAEVMRSLGLDPLEPYPGKPHAKWRCRCQKCGKVVTPAWSYARHGRGICPHCSGQIVNVEQAIELMLSRGLTPLVDFPGSVKPWLCRCENCGRETSPAYSAIYSKPKGGCKWCADKGIDYAAQSIVYLITHAEFGAHKVGIAAETSQRMSAHAREGWETYNTLHVVDGYTAKRIEDQVLSWWRLELGLAHYLLPEQMPHGGFSETVDAEEVNLFSTWEQVLRAYAEITAVE